MADWKGPVVTPGEPKYAELHQVTVSNDEGIDEVNRLLADGWELVDIGHRPDATVYVLGRTEARRKHRTGFLAPKS